MNHVETKLVPWRLLPEQKDHCAAVVNDVIQNATNEPDFLKKVITGGESSIYGSNLERKAQLSQWKSLGSPCRKKARQRSNKIKTTLTVFLIGKVKRCCPSRVGSSSPNN